jgi:type I restriction enzyme M protein
MAGISVCILILARDRGSKKGKHRYRRDEILFIDASSVSKGKKAMNKELSMDDINDIVSTYHQWREKHGGYMDKKGFCKAVKIET